MSLDHLPLWAVPLLPSPVWVLIYFILIALLTVVSGWLLRIRMRRRIKEDLGREAYEGDLTSIGTWMKVDAFEEESGTDQDWIPKSRDFGFHTPEILVNWVRADEAEEQRRNRESQFPATRSVDDYVTLTDLSVLMDRSRREIVPLTLMDLPTRLFRIRSESKTKKKTV